MQRALGCALAGCLLSTAWPTLAQRASAQIQPASSAPTAQQLRQFTSTFQAGVTKGCLSNPPKDARNQRGYCSCYANSFVNRYQPQELMTISRMAAAPQAPNLVAVMMAPEIRVCKLQNQ